MNDSLTDRFFHVSALRPAANRIAETRPAHRDSTSSERLMQLLQAQCLGNRLGKHMLASSVFQEPGLTAVDFETLRLLAPQADVSICDPSRWLLLDTETTGLSGGTGTYAFLVGVAWWEGSGLKIQQFFMRDFTEEPSLLFELARRLAERPVLVTFNGKSFDWPLLQTRYRMTRAGNIPEPEAHLDLLHPARQLWRLRLKSVALAELERNVLHLDRGYDIPSETIPQRYFAFLRGGAPEPVAEIFHHNQMDLRGLAALAVRIMSILEKSAGCGAEELFGLSRILQRRGNSIKAGETYRRALDHGLPQPAERLAQRELALIARRGRDYELSNALWEKLLGDFPESLKAYEQLAIYYEHHAREPQKAAGLTREALCKLQEGFQAGRLLAHKYRQWHGSFRRRLDRLDTRILKSTGD
jgi:uncharacterized protein YprB with RNaseH-like and TPR domain